jgi:hypothetical protein
MAALRVLVPDRLDRVSAADLRTRAARALGEDLLRPPSRRRFPGLLPGSPGAARRLIDTLARPGGWSAELAELAPKVAAVMLGLTIHVVKPGGEVESAGSGPALHVVELEVGRLAVARAQPGPAPPGGPEVVTLARADEAGPAWAGWRG